MASQYPVLYDLRGGQRLDESDSWSSGPQAFETSYWTATKNTAMFGAALAGLHAAGRIEIAPGKRIYDYAVNAIRLGEDLSPGGFLRTFQLSNVLSQFTGEAGAPIKYSAKYLTEQNGLRDYFGKLIGGGPKTLDRLASEGVEFREGKLFWNNGEVALKHAAAVYNMPATEFSKPAAHFSSAYAASLTGDASISNRFFEEAMEGQKYGVQIVGGQNLRQHYGRQAAAWATEGVGRFNRLMTNPLELFGGEHLFSKFQQATQKVPILKEFFKHGFGVRPGAALPTFARLVGKWGVLGTGAWLGWKEVDRQVRNSWLFDNTILEEGTNVGIATVWAKANLAASHIASWTGLQNISQIQESIAPSSTNISTLAAFPIMGMLAGSTVAWGRRVALVGKNIASGMHVVDAAEAAKVATRELTPGGRLAKLVSKITMLKGKSPVAVGAALGAAAGAALIAPFVPGALIPSTPPDELEDIYSGRKEVQIRKGRMWEMGRSPWEGGSNSYYAPHWYPRMRWRAKEQQLWGDDTDDMNEFEKYFRQEFTYDLEKRHYSDRPYPLSSLPFTDIPLIGPALAGTVGKLIKPEVYMHEEEWLRERGGELEYKPLPEKFGQDFAADLGQLREGAPISPYSPTQVISEQIYRLSEMVGLPGFMETAIKEKLTGSQDWFDESRQLESARRMSSIPDAFFEEELGGMLGSNEFYRRLYPHKQNQISQYNPIRNTMPGWMPSAGDRSEDFTTGDAFEKVPLGEVRLPGRGYEKRYPELEGVAPENYPLIHQYKILADVAMYSEAFKRSAAMISKQRKSSEWTDDEERMYRQTVEQLRAKKRRVEFEDYKYLEPYGEPGDGASAESDVLGLINRANAAKADQPGLLESAIGGYWEAIGHGAEMPIEQLTPVSPASKLVHIRDPIESYERTQLYGQEASFWQNPVEHFLEPAAQSAAHAFGWQGTPGDLQQKRSLEDYFDMLKWVKASRLEMAARVQGDMESAALYATEKRKTMFGLNPYARNPVYAFGALPRRDRDYFQAFAQADTSEERAKILEMVPENERQLYLAQWQMAYADSAAKGIRAGLINGSLAADASEQIAMVNQASRTEGMPIDESLQAEYENTKLPGESYADWYRRNKLLPQRLSGGTLPGPDWVGWHPHADLEDVKLKIVQNLALDQHEFNLWDERADALKYKPYINDDTIAEVREGSFDEDEIRSRMQDLYQAKGLRGRYMVSENHNANGRNSMTMSVEHDRSAEIAKMIRERDE
jgi:hypothetical protein